MFVSCWLAEGNGQLYQIKVSIYSVHVQMILRGVRKKGGGGSGAGWSPFDSEWRTFPHSPPPSINFQEEIAKSKD